MIPINKIFFSRFVEPMLESMREESKKLKKKEERKKLKKLIRDEFKNSPIHDKKAINSMMDELEPKDMVEVVEFIKSKLNK